MQGARWGNLLIRTSGSYVGVQEVRAHPSFLVLAIHASLLPNRVGGQTPGAGPGINLGEPRVSGMQLDAHASICLLAM